MESIYSKIRCIPMAAFDTLRHRIGPSMYEQLKGDEVDVIFTLECTVEKVYDEEEIKVRAVLDSL